MLYRKENVYSKMYGVSRYIARRIYIILYVGEKKIEIIYIF